MWKDPIVEEIRKIRLNIETECDNDFDKIFAQAIEAQKKLANRLVSKPAYNSQMGTQKLDETSKSKPDNENLVSVERVQGSTGRPQVVD
jgi:hypothetical protein